MITVKIPGDPVPKARARVTKRGTYTPTATREWEQRARAIAIDVMNGREPITGPVAVTVYSYLAIPDWWPAWKRKAAKDGYIAPTTKPDATNYGKAAEDALVPARSKKRRSLDVVLSDDSQVVSIDCHKAYASKPMTVILVQILPGILAQATKKPEFWPTENLYFLEN